jgi:tetratricopeptide (TPR) repeat protein
MSTPDELVDLVVPFINCDDFLEGRQMVMDQPSVLLSDEALKFIGLLMQEHRQDEGLLWRMKVQGDILKKCRECGSINLAFAQLFLEMHPEKCPEALAEKVAGLNNPEELTGLVEEHPEWLDYVKQLVISNELVNDLIEEISSVPDTDPELRISLCRAALSLSDHRVDPATWASIAGELANSLTRESGDPAVERFEEAIRLYEEVLAYYRQVGNKELEATTLHNLGNALAALPDPGNKFLERGLEYLWEALALRSREKAPLQWAMTRLAIGRALLSWQGEGREEQLEKAMAHLQSSLEVYQPATAPAEWAEAMSTLAEAYLQRSRGTKGKDAARAKDLLKGVIRELPEGDARLAALQGMLEKTYHILSATGGVVRAEYDESLVPVFDKQKWVLARRAELEGIRMEEWVPEGTSLDMWTELITVTRWQHAQDVPFKSFLAGKEHSLRSRLSNGSFEWHSEVAREKEIRYRWSLKDDLTIEDQYELSRVVRGDSALHIIQYAQRGAGVQQPGSDWAERLKAARLSARTMQVTEPIEAQPEASAAEIGELIAHLQSQPVYGQVKDTAAFFKDTVGKVNRSKEPKQWAAINTLCGLYLLRMPETPPTVLDGAIGAFRRAIEVFTRDTQPELWARNVRNIARAYLKRSLGDSESNLALAKYGLEQSNPVLGQLGFKDELGDNAHDLGRVWLRHSEGKDVSELLQAAEYFQIALINRTPETQPAAWAETTLSLGNACLALSKLNAGEGYQEKADALYSSVLEQFAANKDFASVETDEMIELMGYAMAQLKWMDREGMREPRIPDGFPDRQFEGNILYLRPLASAGTLLIPNQFKHPELLSVPLDKEPSLLTIDSVLYRVLGERLLFMSLGGRAEGLGMTRMYVIGGDGWQEIVELQLGNADLIAMIPHNSAGVKWEIETIIKREMLSRCLFIMPPASPAFDVAAMWAEATEMLRELHLKLPPYSAEGLIFRMNASGETVEQIPFSAVWDLTLFDRLRHLLPAVRAVHG